MARRVVVTGVGLVCCVGNTTEETWKSLLSGKTGIDRITQFDASLFNCQIAGEVKDFDPAQFVEKKEIKKLARFMQFAIAASDEALASSRLKINSENAEQVGVYIGSGIGGFEVIEREHEKYLKVVLARFLRSSFPPPS